MWENMRDNNANLVNNLRAGIKKGQKSVLNVKQLSPFCIFHIRGFPKFASQICQI